MKFRDSEASSRQLERNVEETWVRPDTHGIALRVEGVKPGILEALSRRSKKGSYWEPDREGSDQDIGPRGSYWSQLSSLS